MIRRALVLIALIALIIPATIGQDGGEAQEIRPDRDAPTVDVNKAVREGIGILIDMLDDEDKDHWPYEGVYRVRRKIPVGYRIGGTAISGLSLLESPGYKGDKIRQNATKRAVTFILANLGDKRMEFDRFKSGYDVRGWGHTYALLYFLRLQQMGAEPKGTKTKVKRWVKKLVAGLQGDTIASGGWNYSRRGRGSGPQASPFMTGPTLQALFLAKSMGHKVGKKVVTLGLESLERGRTKDGGTSYTMPVGSNHNGTSDEELRFMDKTPGSIARTPVVETTLMLAGRGDPKRLRKAIEDFFTHWKELEVRRQKSGTHIRPYGVAPYYFMYGHYYVAQAIEMIEDQTERDKLRERLNRTLGHVRDQDGSWNDRVFGRSKAFGTAMAIMALQMGRIPRIPSWGGTRDL